MASVELKEIVIKLEQIDDPNTLIGEAVKIEEPDGHPNNSGTSSEKIKTELLSDESDLEAYTDVVVTGEIIKEEVLEQNEKTDNNKNKERRFDTYVEHFEHVTQEYDKYKHFYGHPDRYLCEICGLSFIYISRLNRHYETHLDRSLVKTFECHKCSFKTIHNSYLKSHIERVHATSKEYLCDKCDFRTSYLSSLKKHQVTHFNNQVAKVKVSSYDCDECCYTTKKKYFFNQHKKLHMDKSNLEKFKCNLCPYESIRKVTLSNHMMVHKKISETKSFDCELCDYRTKYPHLLRGHIKTNHKKFPKSLIKKCEKCDFETNNKYTLENHVKKEHIPKALPKVKIYKCDECPYEARKKSSFDNHLLGHKGCIERMYECYTCGKQFKRKDNLKNHIILLHLVQV